MQRGILDVDQYWLSGLNAHDEATFDGIYRYYFPVLSVYAARLVKDEEAGKEIVQEVFLRLWQLRGRLEISSLKAYLFQATRNKCLDLIKHRQVKAAYEQHTMSQAAYEADGVDFYQLTELQRQIETEIRLMPPELKEVFEKHRFGGLTYQQIAASLNISVKTVEARMTRALRLLRAALKEFTN